MSTPHNQAIMGDIAKVVLMPGDPLRAKFIAETFLENPVQFNSVRNMFGYTGTYKGKKVSVMGSGMGMPSIGIYSHELYSSYGVESIIRIGTAGAYKEELNKTILDSAAKTGIPVTCGRIHSSDVFYHDASSNYMDGVNENNCLVVEMESFALFHNAKMLNKKAACIVTVSDSLVNHVETTAEERQTAFTNMMKIALEAAIANE